MAEPFRLPDGGRIERSRPLDFTFNGKRLTGFAGDTVASALLANGIHLVGRSFKYHRPRGIVTAGPEEPSALVQVGEGKARTEPNIRATVAELHQGMWTSSVNAWPSVEFDVGAVNSLFSKFFPAGFYYKTFMWPRSWWEPVYESFIRKAAGLGRAPEEPDPDRYDQTNAHCDVLVVGAGPAGLAATLAASRSGARVILADEQPHAGGALAGLPEETIDGEPAMDWVAEALRELGENEEVRLLPRSTVYGYFDHNFLGVLERVTDHLPIDERPAHLPRHRLWKVRAKQVVLATGAIERSLVFADNDRPGIMLAGAARTYVNRYAVKPGHKAVVMTNNDSGYGAALDLKRAGVEIAAVVDLRHAVDGPMSDRAEQEGLNILSGHGIIATEGAKRVARVRVAPVAEDGTRAYGGGESLDCDFIAMSGGWSPAVHLFSQSKGKLAYDAEHGTFVPAEAAQPTRCAGAANGAFGLDGCLEQGYAAGEQAAGDAGAKSKGGRKKRPSGGSDHDFLPAEFPPLVPGEKPLGHKAKHFVDFQNDVTAADLKLAVREGYSSIEHVKRYTTTGMGTDQGKLGNINALNIVAHTLGRDLPEVGVTTFRPPYTPVTFGAFAGRNVDDLLDPRRTTPMHSWHRRAGAAFEPVGQWLRAWYYPREGEDMHAAVQRESRAVRDSLGILDATTLGKIDIQGPDSAEFLNRVYTNAWSKLEVGKCRYGLMLGEDGMVMDDGVTSRLEENRYLMTTTTGNAAQVLAHLERYLQTQWPDLKVYLTSVTEQFATASIAGPNARKLLAELCDDIDLSPEAFGFMSWRAGTVAGIPARVFRISFTGDLAFEINVPAHYGMALWQALIRAGEKYGITPYGTETMHVLRAEKGFIIVGQETDGSVTPIDLGMDWIVSKKKDFIGRRSLSRPDMIKADRKQLVGLLPEDPNEVLPEGAQMVEKVASKPPMPMVGHVTSSYMSPNLGRSFAMALIKGGRERHGETLFAPLADGRIIAATVTEPLFFDKEGERLRG